MNKKKVIITSILLSFLSMELILRYRYGFCDALLYRSSEYYEYIPQPNQDRYRFGAHIHYNSYSQRNEEPDSTKVKILGLGDSVLFGGTTIDQDSIATSLFTKQTGMQMLNIAAGSWGPDNCAAYLRENGLFDAKAMILVCSSHDAYDVMSFAPVVDFYSTYPSKQQICAIWELIDRYLFPRVETIWKKAKQKLDPDEVVLSHVKNGDVKKKSSEFNSGFNELKMIANTANIPFKIYLHAELKETQAGTYNEMGQAIITWADSTHTELMKGLESGETEDMYIDVIHLNEKGHKHLSNCLTLLLN